MAIEENKFVFYFLVLNLLYNLRPVKDKFSSVDCRSLEYYTNILARKDILNEDFLYVKDTRLKLFGKNELTLTSYKRTKT